MAQGVRSRRARSQGKSFRRVATVAAAAGALFLLGWGCSQFRSREEGSTASRTGAAMLKGRTARATIEGRSNSSLTGEATFNDTDAGVKVMVMVKNAMPGMHAVHIHEKGDCSSPDAKSAGDHFNPDHQPHGAPTAPQHHAGDLGNMEVGSDGNGKLELTSKDLTVSPGTHSVIGRAIVVHEKPDDMVTQQPPGNAGARVGCGVITMAQ
jgi:Cu-Zn family superoxide dismutase